MKNEEIEVKRSLKDLCEEINRFSKKSVTFANKQGNTLMNEKNVIKEKVNIFQRMLEDKRAIRRCIQKGEDLKQLAKQRGIKFATPL